jgi:hypothetical protein
MAQTNPPPLTARENHVLIEETASKWETSHHRLQNHLSAIRTQLSAMSEPPSQDELQNLKEARYDTCAHSVELQERYVEWTRQGLTLPKYFEWEDKVDYCGITTDNANRDVEKVLDEVESMLKVNSRWYNRLRRGIRDYHDQVTE